MPPILSILICSLRSRAQMLTRLRKHLHAQIMQATDFGGALPVEVLVRVDDGQASVGGKRNGLLREARGRYVAFVDDDDWVSSDYVELILAALRGEPDVVGIWGELTVDGDERSARLFHHSLQYQRDGVHPEGTYFRRPNHLNPMRRDIALAARFPEIDCGEDAQFAGRVQAQGKLRRQVEVSDVVYYYRFSPSGTATQQRRPA
jgi:glycosyltransferase involved in cell wall biosynthesis